MALTNLQANITLDVYDHDGAKPSIKAIALDDNTRYVFANIRNRGEVYDIGSSATVQLIVIRPDKVGVQITGAAQGIEIGQEDETTITVYGAYAELDQPAIAVAGTLLAQFKITSGEQILRTQVFQIANGQALDADEWADEYDGYNLEEMATSIETNTADIASLEADVSQLKEDFTDLHDAIYGESTTVETALVSLGTTGIVKNENGVLSLSGSSTFETKSYAVSGLAKVRVKTTAYDSDSYYSSAYYAYFTDDSRTVKGEYFSSYPTVTTINEVVDVPSGSTKVYIVSRKSVSDYINECYSITETQGGTGLVDDIENIENNIAQIDANKREDAVEVSLASGYYITNATVGTTWTNLLTSESGSVYTQQAVNLGGNNVGATLTLTIEQPGSTSGRYFGFCDENNVVISSYAEKNANWVANSDGTYSVDLPIVAPYFFLSLRSASGYKSAKVVSAVISTRKYAYVDDENGADTNNGASPAFAYKTVTKALEDGFERILLSGSKYYQQIDFAKASGKHISIESVDRTRRPTFYDPNCKIVESATLTDGVYSATVTATLSNGNNWLYQDGESDAETLISDAERHPLQRGKTYRCDDTRIVKCTATSLSDALTEIRGATEYKWYLDGTTLYFSAPSAPSASKPICASLGNGLLLNADRSISLDINGVACKYLALNVKNLCDVSLADCSASNVFGYGAITYDNTLNAKFLRCEASRCVNATNGDGFNGDVTNTGDAFAKHYTVTLIDCWSHDNADDGYSSHRHAESTVIGGLFEYNGKGGITPSYGEHCSCYNVYSRHNYNGFLCVGQAQTEEGGKYTQLYCVVCIAEENTRAGDKTGFCVKDSGNRAILVDCRAINNKTSYYCGGTATMRIVDGKTIGQDTVLGGETSNIEIVTTNIVSD